MRVLLKNYSHYAIWSAILVILIAGSLLLTTKLQTADAQAPGSMQPCQLFNYSTFPMTDPGYANYGVPYDVLRSPGNLLMSVQCYRSTDDHVNDFFFLNVGDGQPNTYIWSTGYVTVYNDGNSCPGGGSSGGGGGGGGGGSPIRIEQRDAQLNQGGTPIKLTAIPGCQPGYHWQPITLQGSASQGWIRGSASASVTQSSSYPDSYQMYFLSYTCSYTGDDGYKCGCRDSNTCTASGKWQIQAIPSHDDAVH